MLPLAVRTCAAMLAFAMISMLVFQQSPFPPASNTDLVRFDALSVTSTRLDGTTLDSRGAAGSGSAKLGPPLAAVFELAANDAALHLQAEDNGLQREIFAYNGNLRVENSNGDVQLLLGNNLWNINEARNTAQLSLLPADNGTLTNFMRVLACPPETSHEMLAQKQQLAMAYPQQVNDPQGNPQLLYETQVNTFNQPVELQVTVDPKSKALQRVVTRYLAEFEVPRTVAEDAPSYPAPERDKQNGDWPTGGAAAGVPVDKAEMKEVASKETRAVDNRTATVEDSTDKSVVKKSDPADGVTSGAGANTHDRSKVKAASGPEQNSPKTLKAKPDANTQQVGQPPRNRQSYGTDFTKSRQNQEPPAPPAPAAAVAQPEVEAKSGENKKYVTAPKVADPMPRQQYASPYRTQTVVTLNSSVGQKAKKQAAEEVAVNEPFGNKFVVKETLTEDGRIGKIVDVQGVVALRPMSHDRWTPVTGKPLLRLGDQVRTDSRGANAVGLKLVKNTSVTVGPGSLVELIKPDQIRLYYGQAEIVAEEAAPISLFGPGKEQLSAVKSAVYAVQNEKLVQLENPAVEAKWLAGFKGTAVQESLGSLLAKPAEPGTPDTRMVPLTVGYHKVTVDIRDQIARTVVEESFINHTPARMEGVFYFPLPQDASISGFAMWIGNDLVEADVVEKQRAREIYETILREKRDPGLLEWTGGNIFKARVFPIEGHSEKRIRITYTQVLPLRGNSYHYSYALQSELLRQHPLRDLGVQVQVQSALPLKTFTCPTHTARIQATPHAAQADYSVQDYTPTRDFEVCVQLDTEQSRQNDLVLIPHRRGEDGYFLLQVTPPAETQWERDVLPNGGTPLPLVILADTSASMDAASREKQGEVVAGLLGALTPQDTFNVGCCDVGCEWAFSAPVSATSDNVAESRKKLEQRASLGWTDLDVTLGEGLKMAARMTQSVAEAKATTDAPAAARDKAAATRAVPQIVYVGDGIPTTRDANPQAAAERLRALYAGNPQGVVHTISVGSSYESGILQTLAALNGGTVRHVNGEHGPQVAAFELLNELERPGLRDMQVEFQGIRTARVYPRTLPNLPPGSQQIILGRYLPQGADQTGEVIVTAKQGTTPVRFRAKVSFQDAEQGNEFIPRLWARMHLDSLLEQGQAPAIRDEVISLSEEFNIITPYTSLLVLESDADRERFKVQRRFRMRDGEKYFQDGRDDATFALVQQQMQQAGAWRLNLRQSVLRGFEGLGRNPDVFEFNRNQSNWAYPAFGESSAPVGRATALGRRLKVSAASGPQSWSGSNFFDTSRVDRFESLGDELTRQSAWDSAPDSRRDSDFEADKDTKDNLDGLPAEDEVFNSRGGELDGALRAEKAERKRSDLSDYVVYEDFGVMPSFGSRGLNMPMGKPMGGLGGRFGGLGGGFGGGGFGGPSRGRGRYQYGYEAQPYGTWVDQYFPPLAVTPATAAVPLPSPWPAEIQTLTASLVRVPTFANLQGGLEVTRVADHYTPRGELSYQSTARYLVAQKSWAKQTTTAGEQSLVEWCDPQERGAMSLAYLLGRVRPSVAAETTAPPLDLPDNSMTSLAVTYASMVPAVEPLGADRVRLTITQDNQSGWEMLFLIDTMRHVMLEHETRVNAVTTGKTTFNDFVEAGGSWWPTRTEVLDAKGRRTLLTKLSVNPLDAAAYANSFKNTLAFRDTTFLIRENEIPEWADALRRTAAGEGKVLDHVLLLLKYESRQQWARVFEEWTKIEKLAGDKPGLAWVRRALQKEGRQHAELKADLAAYAQQLAAQPVVDDLFLANATRAVAGSVMTSQELLGLHAVLKPVYDRQPAVARGPRSWTQSQAGLLAAANRPDQALTLTRQMAEGEPTDLSLQIAYSQALFNAGDSPAGIAWSVRALQGGTAWEPSEEAAIRSMVAQQLENEGRYADEVTYLTAWMARNPENNDAYARYLAALVRLDRLDVAYKTIDDWMVPATPAQPLDPAAAKNLPAPATAAAAKLSAAVQQALGQGHGMYSQYIDPRFGMPLAKAALVLGRNESWGWLAQQVSSGRLEQTDGYQFLLQQATGVVDAEVDTLSPSVLNRFMGWMLSNHTVPEDLRNRVMQKLRARWQAAAKPDEKWQLGSTYGWMVRNYRPTVEITAFYHLQVETASAQHRSQALQELYDHLFSQTWSESIEKELFELLPKLSHQNATLTEENLRLRLSALLRLVDKLLKDRFEVAKTAAGRLDGLTRTQLADRQKEWQTTALNGVAQRLNEQRALSAAEQATLAAWMNAERLVLEYRLQRDLNKLAGECWEQLPAEPFGKAGEPAPETVPARATRLLQERMLALLPALAAHPKADPALVERVQKYIDAGVAAEGDAAHWKGWKVRLLIALDKPKELETVLRQWMQNDPEQTWQTMQGYLLAEQGKLEDAVRLFETARERELLGPREHQALAAWYLVLDKKPESRQSQLEAMAVAEEYSLNNALHQRLYQLQNPPPNAVPTSTQVSDKDLLMFGVLLEKSQSPASYTSLLQNWYQSTRDFRLLTGLADAVVGHTAGRVYPLMENISSVLNEMREEATADQLVAHIATLRSKARTDVNQRALDLLETLVERRAAEVQNQGGVHAAKALAAMQRAYRREWSEGERRQMADLLASLGSISQPTLAQEQLRELDELHKAEPVGSVDHLGVTVAFARALGHYDRRQEGIDLLVTSLSTYAANNGGLLSGTARFAIEALIGHYEARQHFADGERYLLELQRQPLVPDQKYWAMQRLFALYQRAVDHGGTVSLGTGEGLYKAVLAKMELELDTPDHGHRATVVRQLCDLFRVAHGKHLPGVAADLDQFSKTLLPGVLLRQTNEYSTLVSTVAETIRAISGAVAAMEFVVTRIEQEPRWFAWSHQAGWQQNAYRLAYWGSEEAKWTLPTELSRRLLKIVLREMKKDLESRTYNNPYIYRRNYGYYWENKSADFAAAAEEVYSRKKNSAAHVVYLAEYFFHGISREDRAIEILFIADGQKILDTDGQSRLVTFLHDKSRYGESVALLQRLIAANPDAMQYRVQLLRALFHTNRKAELQELLTQTNAHFHLENRWTEGAMSELGAVCLHTQLYEQSVAYFKEAISERERTAPNRGIGDGTLSSYYGQQASAYAGLQRTPEAVDAAMGAVVSWGRDQHNQRSAIDALRHVIEQSPDLTAYVAFLDQQVATTKADRPLVRKTLGRVLKERGKLAEAVLQYKLATELEPNDIESQKELIACYESLMQPQLAASQTLAAIRLLPRELDLYRSLGEKFKSLEQPLNAERAWTSMIEMQANESESHQALAQLRQEQNRWPEAIDQWQRVAVLRELEPTGLLGLAGAQIHERRLDAAKDTLKKLRSTSWPARFNTVEADIQRLEQQLSR